MKVSYAYYTIKRPIPRTEDLVLNGTEIPFHISMTKANDTDDMRFLISMIKTYTSFYEETSSNFWHKEMMQFLKLKEVKDQVLLRYKNPKKKGKEKKKTLQPPQEKWYNRYSKECHKYKITHYYDAFNR